MKKAVIWGIGERYRQFGDYLENKYDVIGYTYNGAKDEDTSRINNKRIIKPESLENSKDDWDFIIVCCDAEVDVCNQLLLELHLNANRIIWYRLVVDDKSGFYSEKNEDVMAAYLLSILGITSGYTYLDLGSNHPIYGNNTYAFYKRGGEGILVEANPKLWGVTIGLRPRDQFINKAITLDGHSAEFYSLNQSGLGTIDYESLDEETCKKYENFNIRERILVEGITIGEIIENMSTNTPDLMSIDIEGSDWSILHQIDFGVFRPKIIISETAPWGYYKHSSKEFDRFFSEKGYIPFHFNGANSIYFDSKYEGLIV